MAEITAEITVAEITTRGKSDDFGTGTRTRAETSFETSLETKIRPETSFETSPETSRETGRETKGTSRDPRDTRGRH